MVVRKCPNCSATMPAASKFCPNCGEIRHSIPDAKSLVLLMPMLLLIILGIFAIALLRFLLKLLQ